MLFYFNLLLRPLLYVLSEELLRILFNIIFLVTLFQDWVFTIHFLRLLDRSYFLVVGLFWYLASKKAAALDPAVALRFEKTENSPASTRA